MISSTPYRIQNPSAPQNTSQNRSPETEIRKRWKNKKKNKEKIGALHIFCSFLGGGGYFGFERGFGVHFGVYFRPQKGFVFCRGCRQSQALFSSWDTPYVGVGIARPLHMLSKGAGRATVKESPSTRAVWLHHHWGQGGPLSKSALLPGLSGLFSHGGQGGHDAGGGSTPRIWPPHRGQGGPLSEGALLPGLFGLFHGGKVGALTGGSEGHCQRVPFRKGGGGIAPNWQGWDTKTPIVRNSGVSLRQSRCIGNTGPKV